MKNTEWGRKTTYKSVRFGTAWLKKHYELDGTLYLVTYDHHNRKVVEKWMRKHDGDFINGCDDLGYTCYKYIK